MMTITEAREEVSKCDQEIQSIKAALRGIGNVNSSETNELKIEFSKVRHRRRRRRSHFHFIYIILYFLFVFVSILIPRFNSIHLSYNFSVVILFFRYGIIYSLKFAYIYMYKRLKDYQKQQNQ